MSNNAPTLGPHAQVNYTNVNRIKVVPNVKVFNLIQYRYSMNKQILVQEKICTIQILIIQAL